MKRNSSIAPLSNERRLIERLSGWRLFAFLGSLIVNLGLLAVLFVTPLFLNPSRAFVILALVTASHCVVLVAIAGFRFPISVKLVLGLAHATLCGCALSSVGALVWTRPGCPDVAMFYVLVMIALFVTIGGVVVARIAGHHDSNRFSVRDVLILVTAFAVLFPVVLQFAPSAYFVIGVESERWAPMLLGAIVCSLTCLFVSNLPLKYLSTDALGLSPIMLLIGWFLLLSMIGWELCQFCFLIAVWIGCSLVPVWGVRSVESRDAKRAESEEPSDPDGTSAVRSSPEPNDSKEDKRGPVDSERKNSQQAQTESGTDSSASRCASATELDELGGVSESSDRWDPETWN